VAVLSLGGSVIIAISHNVTRFNIAKVETLFFLFIYIPDNLFPYSLRLLEVFNVTLLAYIIFTPLFRFGVGPRVPVLLEALK
jgi:hypothetical protein